MQTFFERETELGKYPCGSESGTILEYAEPDYALIFVQTVARVCGTRGTLKIEHRCYLRPGGDSPDRPWQEPEVLVEDASGSRESWRQLAESRHEQFAQRMMATFPAQFSA
jgi:hypothetical protein